jgi:hypothetical protein
VPQQNNVPGHQLAYRQRHWRSIAHHVGANGHRMAERLGGLFGVILLDDIQGDRQRQHSQDDEETTVIAADAGDRRRRDQERDQRIEHALAELEQDCLAMAGFDQIWSVSLQPSVGFLLR